MASVVSAGSINAQATRRAVNWQLGIAILCLAALQAWVTLTHDAWLDEWQAMLIAAQSPDLPGLSANLRYEGHPPLWYLILRIAGAVANPEWAMKGAALAVALSTMLIVMLRAPFALFERVALCCGYLLLVEYGSLSRGIGLGVMLMFLFVATGSKPLRWAMLAILPMIEVQFAVLAVAGAAMMLRDRQWSWAGAAVLVLSMAAMVALVWPAPDVHTAVSLRETFVHRFLIFMLMAGNLLVPLPMIGGTISWFGNAPGALGLAFAVMFVALGVWETRGQAWHRLAFLGFCGFTLFMALFVYQLSIRHAGLCAILLVLLTWRAVEAGGTASLFFRLWLAVGAACGLIMAVHIDRVGFDGSGAAARFIRAHGLEQRLWVSYDDPHAVPVTARLGVPNYNITKSCLQTFVRWDRKGHDWTLRTIEASLNETAKRYGEFYLISAVRFEDEPDAGAIRRMVQPIFAGSRGYTGSGFFLYRVGTGRPSTGAKPPLCPPLDKNPA